VGEFLLAHVDRFTLSYQLGLLAAAGLVARGLAARGLGPAPGRHH
jgi:hypothetical protein